MLQASAVVFSTADAKLMVISADHLNMIKFASHQNREYKKVSEHLQLLAEETSDAINAHWKKQNRIRKGMKLIQV